MIIRENKNTPVTAVQIQNLNDVLSTFRQFKDASYLTELDLYNFMTTPSAERAEFIDAFEVTIDIFQDNYATQSI